MYLYTFTQHHNTTAEKTKTWVGTEFVPFFKLNYIIIFYNIAFYFYLLSALNLRIFIQIYLS